MNSHLTILLIVFIINLIISVIYLVVGLGRKTKSIVLKFTVMALCPVLGPMFFGLSYLFYKFFFSEPVDLEDVIFSKDKVKSTFRAEEDRERNLVSIEEAIAVTNESDLRTLMMNVVRGDVRKTLTSISLALESDDSETAHYAASVLQDALGEFRANVEKYRKMMGEDKETRIYAAEAAVQYMDGVLSQKVFTPIEQKHYVKIMENICGVIYDESPESMEMPYLEAVCMRLLEIEDYDACEKWCDRLVEMFPDTLPSFTCRLKLYFNKRDREKFFNVITELKASSVVVDRETLELIRVFM